MPHRLCLEICVESVEYARAAERGGAHRVELCSDLSTGGITPSLGFMETARRHVGIPIHVLIRPRAGDFVYSDDEFEIMRQDIEVARHCGMNGIVLGVLDGEARIDIPRTRALVELAHPLPVTFHRAFDECAFSEQALQDVIQTGCSRILTSSGVQRATDALSSLRRLVETAQERITIMVCGGVDHENLLRVVQATGAREIHTSMGLSRRATGNNGYMRENAGSGADNAAQDGTTAFEEDVGKLVKLATTITRPA
jgi:copper homeostasis protein